MSTEDYDDLEREFSIRKSSGEYSQESIEYDIPDMYARDAFKNCVGAVVPVKIGGIVVGTAKVLDSSGQVKIHFND